jgi:hypothetical protein
LDMRVRGSLVIKLGEEDLFVKNCPLGLTLPMPLLDLMLEPVRFNLLAEESLLILKGRMKRVDQYPEKGKEDNDIDSNHPYLFWFLFGILCQANLPRKLSGNIKIIRTGRGVLSGRSLQSNCLYPFSLSKGLDHGKRVL